MLKSAIPWADVVHICDHSNAFYSRFLQNIPHVVTCHDLFGIRSALGEIPQNPTAWTGKQLQGMILHGLRQARHVACVSEATRRDLLRVAGIPEHRVSRIYNSLNYPYSPMEPNQARRRLARLGVDPSRPFFLHVGATWYKNRPGLLRIFSIFRRFPGVPDLRLVLVGGPLTAEMRRFVRNNQLNGVVQELTGVADEDLRALYSCAAMMLFPSLEEGFGWPIIEAQACGCPVTTSGWAPMNEIGGTAAMYIDPTNPKSAADALGKALSRLPEMREAGLLNAARFRSGMIENYLSLYEAVCKRHAARSSEGASRPISDSSTFSTSIQ